MYTYNSIRELHMKKIALIILAASLLVGCESSERAKATDEKVTGTVQETVGDATNNPELSSEGKKNQLKGDLRNTKEDIKDIVKGN